GREQTLAQGHRPRSVSTKAATIGDITNAGEAGPGRVGAASAFCHVAGEGTVGHRHAAVIGVDAAAVAEADLDEIPCTGGRLAAVAPLGQVICETGPGDSDHRILGIDGAAVSASAAVGAEDLVAAEGAAADDQRCAIAIVDSPTLVTGPAGV